MKKLLFVSLLVAASSAPAQDSWFGSQLAIRSLVVRAVVEEQAATIEIRQTVRNLSTSDQEMRFLFPVPEGAQVTSVDLWVGQEKFEGRHLQADKARGVYHEIVRKQKDPALLEYVGRGLVQASIFPVPPGQERELRATIRQLLPRDGGLTRIGLPLSLCRFSREVLEEASVRVEISSRDDVKSVYSPSHAVEIGRPDDRRATVSWSEKKSRPDADFDLFWATDSRDVGVSLMTYRPEKDKPGYFLLLAAPKVKVDPGSVQPKDVVFVVDRSGSMRVEGKMKQAREALAGCLESLNPRDRFSVVAFSSAVDVFSASPVENTPDARAKARRWLDAQEPLGGTALHEAVKTGLAIAGPAPDPRPAYLVLITDGLPTLGERDTRKFLADVGGANPRQARIVSIGLGYDVNTTLLDGLAAGHGGISDYVKPGQSLVERLASIAGKIRHPVLADLKLEVSGITLVDVQPRRMPDLFHGGQLVIAGRYDGSGAATLTIRGISQGQETAVRCEAFFDAHTAGEGRAFVAQVWAARQIGHLIERVQLEGPSKEVVDEIVRLSTRHGILTEYTAFLAMEEVSVRDFSANNEQAYRNLGELKNDVGARGVNQAENKKQCQEAQQVRANRWNDENGRETSIAQCRNVGKRTFFQKRRVWCDVDADPAQKADEVAYFSDAFFKLLDERPELNRVAALGGDVLVKLDGKQLMLRRAQ